MRMKTVVVTTDLSDFSKKAFPFARDLAQKYGARIAVCYVEEHRVPPLVIEYPGIGFAPPMPHEETQGMSALSRCRQCHVFTETQEVFVKNEFVGLRQDLRKGKRLNPLAPPTLPHKTFMRENCIACHSGPAAREEIRTSHPERIRCRQCHVAVTTTASFVR